VGRHPLDGPVAVTCSSRASLAHATILSASDVLLARCTLTISQLPYLRLLRQCMIEQAVIEQAMRCESSALEISAGGLGSAIHPTGDTATVVLAGTTARGAHAVTAGAPQLTGRN